mmetsp:Transcript_39604/g.38159  ORF Transcript_39604/g.38159 Transcript_39604/m.38159 type:complete len:153 (+) Transcript_39604:481-939(+)
MFKDAVLASNSNKRLVQCILDHRKDTQEDQEPPLMLIHGSESEVVLRSSLMRIKVEQAELLEEQKKKARADGEDEDEDQQDNQTNALDESKEEASTLQMDFAIMADFFCFECPPFTTKIIQGVQNKSLLNLDFHPKQTKSKEEEDLALLDEI